MQGKSILQVLPSLDSGGVERGTIEMVQAIVGAGGTALVASAGGRMVTQVERAGGRHFALSLMTKDPVNILLNAGRLARLVRAERVDLVHARSRAPAWSAWLAARRVGLPFVTTWHGVYGAGLPGKRFYNGIMARGDRVIAISRFVAARLEAEYGVDPARIRTIPRGVDPAVFDPEAVGGDRVHRLAQAWRLPAGGRVIMLPARLTRWKGGEILLRAVAALPPPIGAQCFVVLVGDQQGRASYVRHLTSLAEHLGVASRLRLAGHCDDMPAALMLADVAVSASLQPEPFGRSIIEAQAMGRPVVGFDHGGAAETIEHGVTGWRVPPGDAVCLSAAILAALGMDEWARECLAAQARASVLGNYTTRLLQNATLATYRELI
jgi:glycosyltransferase involved in cell wall biosynthesis